MGRSTCSRRTDGRVVRLFLRRTPGRRLRRAVRPGAGPGGTLVACRPDRRSADRDARWHLDPADVQHGPQSGDRRPRRRAAGWASPPSPGSPRKCAPGPGGEPRSSLARPRRADGDAVGRSPQAHRGRLGVTGRCRSSRTSRHRCGCRSSSRSAGRRGGRSAPPCRSPARAGSPARQPAPTAGPGPPRSPS